MQTKFFNQLLDLAETYQEDVKNIPVGVSNESTFILRKLFFFIVKAWILTVSLFLLRK